MALLQIFRNPADTDGSLNRAIIAAALLLATEGIELEPGNWDGKAASGAIALMPTNRTISGSLAFPGSAPITKLKIVGSDGAGGSVIACAAPGQCTGIKVKNLEIDGGRVSGSATNATWGGGACISLAGQNDYPTGQNRHGVELTNLVLYDGLYQQVSTNSVNGFTWSGVNANAFANPLAIAHGCDFDAVAYDKPSANGLIQYCTLNAYGQESVKFENTVDVAFLYCTISMYLTIIPDRVDVYAETGRISFTSCTIDAPINVGLLKRRHIPGAFTVAFGSDTCTLSATSGTAVTTSGHVFVAGDVGKQLSQEPTANTGRGVIIAVNAGNATVNITNTFSTTSLTANNWQLKGTHYRPTGIALTLTGSWGTVGASITISGYPFINGASGHVGQMVGFYSGVGVGAAIITSVTASVATATVVDAFTSGTISAGNWILAWTDNNGDGSVTWSRNTFTDMGMIFPQDAAPANYGTQTIKDNWFSLDGNSYKYPASTPITASGNANDALPQKRFARPTANAKYAFIGGATGIAGLNAESCAQNATTNINTAIAAAVNGDVVVALDGLYTATAGGANRNMSAAGKTILVRARSKFGAVIDLSGGSGWFGISSATDVVGSKFWGFVMLKPGGGGNGVGVNITGGSLKVGAIAVIAGSSGNSGPGIKITGGDAANPPEVEDYWLIGCSHTGASQGALYVSSASGTGAPILRRGVIRDTVGASGAQVAAARIDYTGTVIQGLEICNSSGGCITGGITVTKAATINNLTCAKNVGTTAHDFNLGAAVTVTGDSWICWSDNASAVKAVNVALGTLVLDRSTIYGGSGNVTGAGTKTLTNIASNDPQFEDLVGGNLRPKKTSPARGAGVLHADTWDAMGAPFAAADQGAWARVA